MYMNISYGYVCVYNVYITEKAPREQRCRPSGAVAATRPGTRLYSEPSFTQADIFIYL